MKLFRKIKFRKGIGLAGDFQLGVFNVCVDLGGVQVLVTQHLLNGFHIHAAGEHHGRRRVPQLVGGELGGVQPSLQKGFFHQPMDRRHADAVLVPGAEEGAVVGQLDLVPFLQIGVNGLSAGRAKVDKALLVALADDPDAILVNVRQVQPHQLAAPDAAVQEEHENGVVPFLIWPGNRLQKCGRFLHGQVFRQAFPQFWVFQVGHRIFAQLFGSYRQVLVEGLDGRELSRPAGSLNPALRHSLIRPRHPIIGKVGEEIEDFGLGNRPQKVQVNIPNVDGLQIRINGHLTAHELHKP